MAIRLLHPELGLPTNPIRPLDLAFALPVVAYGGIRLLRSDARALARALPALAFLVLIGFAVLAVFVFDIATGGDPTPVPMAIVGTITTISVVLCVAAMLPESWRSDGTAAELQRAEGPEPAAALSLASFDRSPILAAYSHVSETRRWGS